jgi:hypothetical protein
MYRFSAHQSGESVISIKYIIAFEDRFLLGHTHPFVYLA